MKPRRFVIVGGGSSGLSLARKLLGCNEVVLIERGTFDLQSSNQGDGSEVKLNIYPQLNIWCFRSFVSNLADRMCTATQLNLCSRVISYAQGFGGGGSGGVNAMIYTLGSKFVYDQFWGASWCSERIETLLPKILCYYQPRKMKSSGFVREMLSVDSVNDCSVMDCNGYMPDYYASIEKLGTDRLSQVRACLGPEIPKGLTILEHCTVQRVTFDGADAKGVVVSQRNNDGSVTEKLISPAQGGEIILCAGVFESPRILLASGLKEGIAEAGIAALPDLGEHLQDHVVLPYMLLANWFQGWDIVHPASTPGYGGKPAYPLNGIHGWVNLAEDGEVWSESSGKPPSIQLLFIDGRVSAGIIPTMLPRYREPGLYSSYLYPILFRLLQWVTAFSLVRWLCGYFFGVLVCVTQPKSRGNVRVDPAHPSGPLIIDPCYLQDPRDVDMLHCGMRTARALVQRQVARGTGFWCLEVFPGPLFCYGRTRPWFDFFARMMANTYFHACGTCCMSADHASVSAVASVSSTSSTLAGGRNADDAVAGGVVDEELRVHGVRGLRVADASVIPFIPSAPTHAICMVIGEACGQLLLAKDG